MTSQQSTRSIIKKINSMERELARLKDIVNKKPTRSVATVATKRRNGMHIYIEQVEGGTRAKWKKLSQKEKTRYGDIARERNKSLVIDDHSGSPRCKRSVGRPPKGKVWDFEKCTYVDDETSMNQKCQYVYTRGGSKHAKNSKCLKACDGRYCSLHEDKGKDTVHYDSSDDDDSGFNSESEDFSDGQ